MTMTATNLTVTIRPPALSAALTAVGRAISARTTLPILNNLLLEVTEDGIALTATNLELGIRTVVQAEVEGQGATTVPAKLLSEFVALLPDEPLTMALESTTQTLELRCGRFETHIKCIDASEFPPGPTAEGGSSLTLPLGELLHAVEQTVGAASTDEARPVMTGVLLAIEGTRLTLAATDGHRLAERTIDLPANGEVGIDEDMAAEGARLIVPARALSELARAFRGGSGTVTVTVSAARNQVFIRCGSAEVTSRLIDGQYPNYGQVVPTKATTTIRLGQKELLAALRAVSVFAGTSANVVRLAVQSAPISDDPEDFSIGQLHVRAATNEVGDSTAALEPLAKGADVEVNFNGRYLTDAAAAVDGETVEILLDGPLTQALIRAPGDDGFRAIVMPVRVAQ